jgi:hypothetical protein
MKNLPSKFRVARCVEESEPYGMTSGKYYIICDESTDMVDNEMFVVIRNDFSNTVNVRKSRFDTGSFQDVTPSQFRDLNRSHFNQNSDLVNLIP